MRIKALFVFGTRPEAIKMCPAIREMQSRPEEFSPRVCVTGQHREMLRQVLDVFGIRPDHDLALMQPAQSLSQATGRMIAALEPVIAEERPDVVLVQGDTTTTFCGALAAFHARIPVAHIEAGLRTWDYQEPFPEEMNRVLTGRIAAFHFAATRQAAENLFREGVEAASVAVTGNTGIDAVLHVKRQLEAGSLRPPCDYGVPASKRLIVLTAHRRESFGAPLESICGAVRRLARRDDVSIVYPVHPNPNVREQALRQLAGHANIRLVDPLDYVSFVKLLCDAYLVLTDSGGIQEEAPSLGKPVLVLRDKTERPEAVEAGTARLVGPHADKIVPAAEELLDDEDAYRKMAYRHNPYGDGRAGVRIADVLKTRMGSQRSLAQTA